MLTSSMSRLSFARVLIELDLLVELPHSINVVLPNGACLVQPVAYETLPKFYKHCRVLGHTTVMCSKVSPAMGANNKGSQDSISAGRTSRVSNRSNHQHSTKATSRETLKASQGVVQEALSLDPMHLEARDTVDRCCDVAVTQINYPSLNKQDSIEQANGRSHEKDLVQIFMLDVMQFEGN